MMIGIDLASGTDGKDVSVAAIVGSMDPLFTEYRASIRSQVGKSEHIEDFWYIATHEFNIAAFGIQ
jgi:hypothetical protein